MRRRSSQKITLVIGLFLACPIWLYQAWQFVAPGLYANEKLPLRGGDHADDRSDLAVDDGSPALPLL
jgi:hypothetical protein